MTALQDAPEGLDTLARTGYRTYEPDLELLLGDPAPPPRRSNPVGMLGRAVLLCIAAGGLLAGIFGLIIWFTASHTPATGAVKAVRGYYSDLRDGRYAQAYDRLCDPGATEAAFVSNQQALHDRGRGVSTYDIHAGFTGDTSTLGSAGGVVTLANGSKQTVRFDLETLDPGLAGSDAAALAAGQCLLPS